MKKIYGNNVYGNNELIRILDQCKYIFNECLEREFKKSPLKTEFSDANKELPQIISNIKHETKKMGRDKLDSVGLDGDQLKLKIKGFDNAYKLWNTTKTKQALLQLLKWLNTILGSLSAIVPSCEILKEYKECLENHLSDDIN